MPDYPIPIFIKNIVVSDLRLTAPSRPPPVGEEKGAACLCLSRFLQSKKTRQTFYFTSFLPRITSGAIIVELLRSSLFSRTARMSLGATPSLPCSYLLLPLRGRLGGGSPLISPTPYSGTGPSPTPQQLRSSGPRG